MENEGTQFTALFELSLKDFIDAMVANVNALKGSLIDHLFLEYRDVAEK